jgi:hypothetical protein
MLEEYGTTYNHTVVLRPWQEICLSVNEAGLGGDTFWQMGTYFTDGTPSANFTTNYEIVYGSGGWRVLITEHVAAIRDSP